MKLSPDERGERRRARPTTFGSSPRVEGLQRVWRSRWRGDEGRSRSGTEESANATRRRPKQTKGVQALRRRRMHVTTDCASPLALRQRPLFALPQVLCPPSTHRHRSYRLHRSNRTLPTSYPAHIVPARTVKNGAYLRLSSTRPIGHGANANAPI